MPYFNSIKVRLEHEPGLGKTLQSIFQFHKGTIRTNWTVSPCGICLNFNSIKVRLELYHAYLFWWVCSDFNSIKVRLELEVVGGYMGFESYFNSIKVRLEPRIEIRGIGYHPDFNSIKVRLELIKVLIYALGLIFQFHKGTIRTF